MKKHLLEKIITVKPFTPSPSNENTKRCKQCNSELLVLSRQTRSADEGATTFYRCLKCYKTIKIS